MQHTTRTLSLIVILALVASSLLAQNPIQINFGTSTTFTGWNAVTAKDAGAVTNNLVDMQGANSGISLTNIDSWNATGSNGPLSGALLPDGSGLDNAVSQYYLYYQGINQTRQIRFDGLNNNLTYKIEIFSSRDNTTESKLTQFSCTGKPSESFEAKNNKSYWVTFNDVQPSNGSVTLGFMAEFKYCYVNAIVITPIDGNTPQYSLTTDVLPINSGSVSPLGGSYYQDAIVELIPYPETGYTFSHWSGDANGNAVPLLLDIGNSAKHIVANFVEDNQPSYSISINPSPANGSIGISPAGPYTANTRVTLTANPDPGYVFKSWGGDFSAQTSSSFSFDIASSHTVTASFEAEGGGGTSIWNEPTGDIVQTTKSVNIGTSTSNTDTQGNTYLLSVDGMARATKIVIESSVAWPDYVFEADYELRSLEELQAFIDAQGHLPEVPSATQVESQGISVGEMDAALLRKIEELTLYILQLENRITELEANK